VVADYQPGNAAPVSASAVPVGDGSLVFTEKGEACAFPTPRALELGEIPGVVQQFANAARNAIAAGFHGVEV
jgi:2,4-dienoyl-CoA reductase-like NADH-dependent reductase (Old Yellow Enzyme family)